MFSFKKLSIIAFLIAFVLSFIPAEINAQSKKKAEQPETYPFKGKVVSAESGEALINAKVSVVGKEIETETGKEGTFTFEKLLPDTYTLEVNKEGYKKWKKKVTFKKGLKVLLRVKPESSN